MPTISIVIPVYNGEKTIEETIDSIRKQIFQAWELIIINDGSQDQTLEIVSRIQDSRLKVFSYPNSGQAVSRNRGISHAKGEYISFIDADDLWTADKLDAQLKMLQQNPQAAVAYSHTNYIDESGNFISQGSYMSFSGDVYNKLLLIDFVESGSNPLIRASALAEVGGFDKSVTPNEDWDMWLRLAARYHFVAVPSVQILYRRSANSASTNILKMEAASLKVIEKCFAETPSLEPLKRDVLGNRYKCLTFTAIEKCTERSRGLVALRFLWNSVKNDPDLLRTKVIWKVLLKIVTVSLIPNVIAQKLLTSKKQAFNITALFQYLRQFP